MKIICSGQSCLNPPLLSTAFLCLITSTLQWSWVLSSWDLSWPPSLWSHTHSCGISSHICSAPALPLVWEELLAQAPERESDWLAHHTELSTYWLTVTGSDISWWKRVWFFFFFWGKVIHQVVDIHYFLTFWDLVSSWLCGGQECGLLESGRPRLDVSSAFVSFMTLGIDSSSLRLNTTLGGLASQSCQTLVTAWAVAH